MHHNVDVGILVSMKTPEPAPKVKTSLELPEELWRAAKIRAMEERSDLKSVLIAALEAYLKLPKRR